MVNMSEQEPKVSDLVHDSNPINMRGNILGVLCDAGLKTTIEKPGDIVQNQSLLKDLIISIASQAPKCGHSPCYLAWRSILTTSLALEREYKEYGDTYMREILESTEAENPDDYITEFFKQNPPNAQA